MAFMPVVARWMIALGITMCAATAQTLAVSEGPLVAGEEVEITLHDPGRAGQEVEIEVSDGDPVNPTSMTVKITLGKDGKGRCAWTVKAWEAAEFVAPDAPSVTRLIMPG